jgi:putative restriction endonuclease
MPMAAKLIDRFERLNVWSRGSQRAPHKPLLVLYALGRLSRGVDAPIPFRILEQDLTQLLMEFGPSRKSYHPEYPFWRLQNDGIWLIDGADSLQRRKSSTDAKKSELLDFDARGGFTADVLDEFRSNPRLIAEIAQRLLSAHFPDSLHADIVTAVGLDLDSLETVTRKHRDPTFRNRVLLAYEFRCAVCDFDVRFSTVPLAVEAAHIKWHQAGGPEIESNGICLCSLHHKLFDLGAFTLIDIGIMVVSQQAQGHDGLQDWLLRFHGRPIRSASSSECMPSATSLHWHFQEVFKQPARPT